MDHHTVAAISLCGICLDVLGGLYLAYDLLGGRHGPLRLLTRMVTYSLVFGAGYGAGMGLVFGIAAGLTTGVTIAIELNRTGRNKGNFPLPTEAAFAAVRSIGIGIGLYPTATFPFAVAFAALAAIGQTIAYSRGVRPSLNYSPSRSPRISRIQLLAGLVRTAGYIVSALVCSAFVSHVEHPWSFALRLGLTTGIVTVFGGALTPFIEHYAESMPDRRLGVIGICILFCGFVLQSVQYLLVLLDVAVT